MMDDEIRPSLDFIPIVSEENENQTCTVFTLNCWGIPCVSKDRRPRFYAIAKHLVSSGKVDFVCLQEVWSLKDYLFLTKKCSSQFPYSHFFNSFINGSGLCILSKYPILDVYYHKWPINGYAHKIHQGDWFGGKGVALCRIKMRGSIVHLYTTHLHAEYDYERLDYLTHRILQAFDTSQFIKLTSGGADIVILAGDLNTEPQDLAIKILRSNAQLVDSFDTAQKKGDACLGTNEGYRNSYSPKKELKRQPEGKRIDYIMFKGTSSHKVDALEYMFPLPDRVPGETFSYSDHEAVQVTLSYSRGAGDAQGKYENKEELKSALTGCVTHCDDALKELAERRVMFIVGAVILGILLLAFLFIELFWKKALTSEQEQVAAASSIVIFNILKITWKVVEQPKTHIAY